MLNLNGSGVALITPFLENGDINYKKLEELILYHIVNKTDFLVPCGTTGESSTLSNEEKKEMIKFVVEKTNKKLPVIAGTGSNNTKIAIEMSKYAKDIGADGVLVVTPYYNKCNSLGLYNHYKKIAEAIYPLPLILYNVPSRTCVDIPIDIVVELSKISNIIGIKEANTSLSRISEIIQKTHKNFKVFSGNDDLTLPILALGGNGVISVAANIIPDKMHYLVKNNDINIHNKYFQLMQALFLDVNPIMIKEAMNILGYNVGNTRLPLDNTKNENIEILKQILKEKIDEI